MNGSFIEWGYWECPVCGSAQEDPEGITETCCMNGHVVILGPIIALSKNYRQAWESK